MSKWRPIPLNCLYVIPDVHGQLHQLKLICNRIFPLRKSDGGHDKLVMLGDYIDRDFDGPEVVDFLIAAKKKYKDQLILLCGNHEQMLLDVAANKSSDVYRMWMRVGGEATLSRYLQRANEPLSNPYELPHWRIGDFIPKEHLEFYRSLLTYYELDEFIFVHGGCDPTIPLYKQSKEELIWDRRLNNFVQLSIKNNQPLLWDKTIIAGHNSTQDGKLLITEKFMMLDCSYARKLLVAELNSMEAFIAGKKKGRLVKFLLKDGWQK